MLPISSEFEPDLIFVSSGFDAAVGDQLGQCAVTPHAFAQMTWALMALGPIIMALEGGRCLDFEGSWEELVEPGKLFSALHRLDAFSCFGAI